MFQENLDLVTFISAEWSAFTGTFFNLQTDSPTLSDFNP